MSAETVGQDAAVASDREIRPFSTVFPGELFQAPRHWVKRAYHNLVYFNEVDRGGHFAAREEPELFAQEMRATFASLR